MYKNIFKKVLLNETLKYYGQIFKVKLKMLLFNYFPDKR